VAFFVVVFGSTKIDKSIKGFENLHGEMRQELERINNINIKDKKNLENEFIITLSFTPAFGNISLPDFYENENNNELTYKYLLDNIVSKDKVPVNLICYNKEKRLEFHKIWAPQKADKNVSEDELIEKWERQAQYIIEKVRAKFGYTSVKEIDALYPIFIFASRKVTFLYVMKEEHNKNKNEVIGTKITNPETITFIRESLYSHFIKNDIIELFESTLTVDDIKNAKKLKYVIIGKAFEKHKEISEFNILIAYGGGKDSTWVLAYIRYIQELVKTKFSKTFKLHLVTYVHPGMTPGTIKNIKTVYEKLKIIDSEEIRIHFATIDGIVIKTDEILGDNFSLEDSIIEKYRREILLFGHISHGAGRQTFCYSCNILMVKTMLDYVSSRKGKECIDYIVTGDSIDEKSTYSSWIKAVNNNNQLSYNHPQEFLDDYNSIYSKYQEFIGNKSCVRYNNHLTDYPSFLELFNFTDYSYEKHKDFLENKIGFKLYKDSFNFSESDCFFPSVMAHFTGLRNAKITNYEHMVKQYVDSITKTMKNKQYSNEMIGKATAEYLPSILPEKIRSINQFLSKNLKISENQLDALIKSPLVDSAGQLNNFLESHNIVDIDSDMIINYIIDKSKINIEKKELIDDFFCNYIGLKYQDVKFLFDLKNENNLIEKISKSDPHIRYHEFDGSKIIISGR
jgi:hypothetical protein